MKKRKRSRRKLLTWVGAAIITASLVAVAACGPEAPTVSKSTMVRSSGPAPVAGPPLLTGVKTADGHAYRFFDETSGSPLSLAWNKLMAEDRDAATRSAALAPHVLSFDLTRKVRGQTGLTINLDSGDTLHLEGADGPQFESSLTDGTNSALVRCTGSLFDEDCVALVTIVEDEARSQLLLQLKSYYGYLPTITETGGGNSTNTGKIVRGMLDLEKNLGTLQDRLKKLEVEPIELKVSTVMGGSSKFELTVSNAVREAADHRMFVLAGDLAAVGPGDKLAVQVSKTAHLDIPNAWLTESQSGSLDSLHFELDARDLFGDQANDENVDFEISTKTN